MQKLLLFSFAILLLACGGAEPENPLVTSACEGNLTGTVEADPEIRAATEISEYRYEYNNQSGGLVIDLLDDSGASLAVMQIETAGTSAAMYTAAGKPKEIGPGRSHIVADDGSELVFFRSSEMHYSGFQTAEVGGQQTLLGNGLRHSQHLLSNGSEIEILYTEDSQENIVAESLKLVVEAKDGRDPSIGETFERIVPAESGGWDVVTHHMLDLGALRAQDENLEARVETFLVESGYDDFVENSALEYWRWSNLDFRWQQTFVAHLSSCVSGEPFDPETLRPVAETGANGEAQQPLEPNWEACENAIFGAMGVYSLAGLCFAAVRVQPLAALALCPAALYAGFRFIRSSVRCACTSYEAPRAYNVVCASCDPVECANSCKFKGRETCGDPIIADGQCVLEEEKDIFGLYDSWCSCIIVGPNQAGPGALLSDEDVSCSSGDPHIITMDGLRYSSHSTGEFVAVRSELGDLEIQVRQEPWRSDTCSGLAVNTAAAVKINDTVASFYVRADEMVRVDGEGVVVGPDPISIGTARLDRIGSSFHIETTDGDSIFVDMKTDSIDVTFSPAPSRKGSLSGKFGTYNDDPDDDLTASDGIVISSPFTNELLDEAFANSWAVSTQDTLFHYAAGESVEGFQQGLMDVTAVEELPADLAQTASSVCSDFGVDESVINACILDVVCTGDDSFASSHPTYSPERVATQGTAEDFSGFTIYGDEVDWTLVNGAPGRVLTLGDVFYPTFFVSSSEFGSGNFQVSANAGGTDAIGIVFGWKQPASQASTYYQTYILVWIGESDTIAGLPVQEGLHLLHVDGDFASINDLRLTLWAPADPSTDSSRVTIIDSAYGDGLGWNAGQIEQIMVNLDPVSGIEIRVAGKSLFEVAPSQLPPDSLSGRFGLMSLSSRVEFSNFGIFSTSAGTP